MFERYTEKARRVIFFARYEASEYGSPCIETEHLLLGLLREISYISYEMGTVTVLAVLTHKEYDKGGWKNACNC